MTYDASHRVKTLTEGSGGSYTVGGVTSSAASLKNGDRSAATGHWTVTSGRTLDIVFAGSREIEEVVLLGNPGLTNNPQPKETDTYATTSSFDTSKYTVQTWSGTAWVTQGTVTGNKNVIRHVTFAPVSTTKVRIIPVDDASNGQTSNDNVVSLAEVEVYTTPAGGGSQLQRFDAWGNTTQSAGAAIPQYGYTGREPDATGLIYYRARYYDPTVGRFISRDPAGMPNGVNRFAYVGNDPINNTDPSGLFFGYDNLLGGVVNAGLGAAVTYATGGGTASQYLRNAAVDFGVGFVSSGVASVGKVATLSKVLGATNTFTGKGLTAAGAEVYKGTVDGKDGLSIGVTSLTAGALNATGIIGKGAVALSTKLGITKPFDRSIPALFQPFAGTPSIASVAEKAIGAPGDFAAGFGSDYLGGLFGGGSSSGSNNSTTNNDSYFSNTQGTGGSGYQTLFGVSPGN